MHFKRSSGVLLHITSLPGPHGVGDLGDAAYRFVDFLQDSGQSIWQLLPLGPTAIANSPYSSYSAFAGNPLLISLEALVEDGLLAPSDLPDPVDTAPQADYEYAQRTKWPLLERAFQNYRSGTSACDSIDRFEEFCTTQKWWLEDFALFSAAQQHFGTGDWPSWDRDLVTRSPDALGNLREELDSQFEYAQFLQFLFYKQWQRLKNYANQRDVRVFGDMPIFVAHGSADVWAHQADFLLAPDGRPTHVAGVPPDYFSKTGQLWGNPLYDWQHMEETDYAWWKKRFRSAFDLFNLLRIDHFRGFESYWEVPASAKTAVDGRWVQGPGAKLFQAVERELGRLPIIAEDLGLITDAVHQLRDEVDFPGMRVLQFGFDSEDDNFHRPEAYPEHSAAYTGTHDNETIVGWYLARQRRKPNLDILDRYLDDGPTPINWQLIRLVFDSAANTAIIPLQDILGLDNSSRMNVPGKAFGNWEWQFDLSQLSQDVREPLRRMTEETGRLCSAAARHETVTH